MMSSPVLADHVRCTGCAACFNVCPKSAISMNPDQEGFLVPSIDPDKCIHCGLCEKTCPVLHARYENNENPECYAMMASDEERALSSSGAFVPLVARWVLEHDGIVYGAAWRENWSVHHVRINSIDRLSDIRSSKYLQSDPELTYKQAVHDIKDGRYVCYTGTPCEIAALYACIGNIPHDQLITVEIICHGTPSYKAFSKYLKDNEYNFDEIKSISFRDKAKGWHVGCDIYKKDGTEIHESASKNPYISAFNPCLMMRRSCELCPFSRLPRQADFSAGDFWGIKDYKAEYHDKKGTSFVLINNDKAKKFVSSIEDKFKLWKKVDINAVTRINQTVLHPFNNHPGRKHFYSCIDIKPFNELCSKAMEHHYDYGIIGLWYGINYGSVLTYYALYSFLRDLGYDAVMLPRPNSLWFNDRDRFDAPDSIAQKFIWKHCNVFSQCRYQEEYLRFNDYCDNFILGSDVVWNYNVCGRDTGTFFFLDWVEEGHRKIAYAASFGNGLSGPDSHQRKARLLINKLDSVAVRESSGVELIKKQCGREDVAHVLDPVFMCNPSIYDQAISEVNPRENSAVFVYMLRRHDAKKREHIINIACKKYGVEKPVFCANPNGLDIIRKHYSNVLDYTLSVEEWLYYMKNAKIYIGDSYHGLCFALIFHVPFLIVYGEVQALSTYQRFVSLLKIVGLDERIMFDASDFKLAKKLIDKNIDWDDVDRRLQEYKDFSLQWIRDALGKEPRQCSFEEIVSQTRIRQLSESVVQARDDAVLYTDRKFDEIMKIIGKDRDSKKKDKFIKKIFK